MEVLSFRFWLQPVLYTVHGWLATKMAIWLLFHPYEPVYIPLTKLRLPLTPGIFPRGRKRLAVAIANAVTGELVTSADLSRQAEKLVTEENIYRVLDLLLDSLRNELKDITHLRRLYRTVDEVAPKLLSNLVGEGIRRLEEGHAQPLRTWVDQFIFRVLPHLSLNPEQAQLMARVLVTHLLTPNHLRQGLLVAMADVHIGRVVQAVQSRIGGWQGILVRFLDLEKGLYRFREFLKEEPEAAESLIAEVLSDIDLEARLAERLGRLSAQQLSAETLDTLSQQLFDLMKEALMTHRQTLSDIASNLSEEATQALTQHLLQQEWTNWGWYDRLKKDTAAFLNTYLHKELESLISYALPAIGLHAMIVDKVDQFSAQELEDLVHRICKRELLWLEALGAFIGFWLGLFSNFVT
jgi:uncharacterized membrane protein YheB (UPF0754 family)